MFTEIAKQQLICLSCGKIFYQETMQNDPSTIRWRKTFHVKWHSIDRAIFLAANTWQMHCRDSLPIDHWKLPHCYCSMKNKENFDGYYRHSHKRVARHWFAEIFLYSLAFPRATNQWNVSPCYFNLLRSLDSLTLYNVIKL